MALTPEDKKDVKTHLGKALANKVSSVTRDGGHPSKEFKTSISDVRNNFSKEYKEKGLAMRAERVAKEAKSKALQGKKLDKESRHIYRKTNAGAKQGNWMKVMPGDR
ncbi:MAG: hypothetical protein WC822_06680 [Candidatus Paceibacterota bacterium]|jgi:Sec-independent protein translocase protein TatA